MATAMLPLAFCFFCEDIREEKAGTDTVVGVMPDNMDVPMVPVMMPRLGIYGRAVLSAASPPGSVSLRLEIGGAEGPINLSFISADQLQELAEQAKRDKSETFGIIVRAKIMPMPIQHEGPIRAIMVIDDNEIVGATLNVRVGSNQAANATIALSPVMMTVPYGNLPAAENS